MTIKLKTTTYCIFFPPLILLLCRFNNSLHIARGNFYLPQSLRSRRRNDKKKMLRQKNMVLNLQKLVWVNWGQINYLK